jgi:glycosyltransferase involved in cell wall biosynthesis
VRIGFYNPYLGALGGGDRYLLSILREATRLTGAEVELYCPRDPRIDEWERVGVTVDPARVRWLALDDEGVTARSADLDLLVVLATDVPVRSRARFGVAVVQFPFVDRSGIVARARAQAGRLAGRGQALASLRSYPRYLCYSEFARGWIARRLGVEALVVAPPVDVPEAAAVPAVKDRAILAVARFVPGGHAKRHDVLIDAFRALGADGWTLHLAGTANDDAPARDLLRGLHDRAEGAPVDFHVNASRVDLVQMYERSSFLWHGAGFGSDPEREPEQLEHFGIAVAEALAYGAVPLVVGAGGPAEIVRDGVDGRHWRQIDELVAHTRTLIEDPAAADRLRASGRERALGYSTPRFVEAIGREVFAPAGVPAVAP